MLQPSVIKFLKGLKKNNNKPWFDKNRDQYEAARSDFHSFLEQLIAAIAVFDKPIGTLAVKECVFRINRDIRFSKDKTPYKSNMAGYFNKDGKKSNGAGYYLHIEPGRSFAAGGMWQPIPPDLAKIRQEIDYNFNDWKKISNAPSFKKMFAEGINSEESLVRPPKGYDDNNPAIEYLKMKNFIVSRSFTDAGVQNKNFVKDVAKTFQAMKPLIDFLNTAIE
ncbi:MAG TPA: DUF2461 domain-containing protein [Ferruginibacter sp.]|nr:DUF2461 domain-containing protein [Ferruginibacter sp.]